MTWVTAEPPFIRKPINYMQQTELRRQCRILPSATHMLDVNQSATVTKSVVVSKMWVVLRQAWNDSQWTVSIWQLKQMLAAIRNVVDGNFLLQLDLDSTRHVMHPASSKCFSAEFSTSIFPELQLPTAQSWRTLISRLFCCVNISCACESTTLQISSSDWKKCT